MKLKEKVNVINVLFSVDLLINENIRNENYSFS